MIEIIIKHERKPYASSAKARANGLEMGRVEYVLRDKTSTEKTALGPRVGRYWGRLPGGMEPTMNWEDDAEMLLYDTCIENRTELIEFFISAEHGKTPQEQRERERMVEQITDDLAEAFFPWSNYLACRHGDRHPHVHLLIPNSDVRKRGIRITGAMFNRIRQCVEEWSQGKAKSGWGKGRVHERALAGKTKAELEAIVERGELRVTERDKKGKLDTLEWTIPHQKRRSLKARIRWWKEAELLGDRASWLELQIQNSEQRANERKDEQDRIRILAKEKALQISARAQQLPPL